MSLPRPLPDPSSADEYPLSKRHAWFTFVVLFALMLFDYIDRSLVIAMFPALKQEWKLSDTQLGLLASAVPFIVGLLCIPTAWLVDRWSRTKSIAIMGTLWSLATVMCMFAGNFSQLLLLRGVVGVGEAGYGPAGLALLSYHFPKKIRSTVFSGFLFAVSLGSVLGVVIGGYIAARWGWRTAFGVVGLPGVLFALGVLAVRDYPTVAPPRPVATEQRLPVLSRAMHTLKELLHCPTARYAYFGNALAFLIVTGVYTWLPSFFNRFYGLDMAMSGAKGAVIVMSGACGMVFWAYASDKVSAQLPNMKLLIPAASASGSFLIFFYAFFVSVPGQAQILALMLGAFLLSGSGAVTFSVAMDVTHPALRSTAASVVTLTGSIVGFAGGPFLVGLLSDQLGLNAALGWVTSFAVVAAACLALASRTYARDRALTESIT